MQFQKQTDVLKFYKASFKSKFTAIDYICCLKRYCNDWLSLLRLNQKQAEDKLISFIIENKEKGMNWGALHNYVAAVVKFYEINDISLNLKRVKRFMPEQVKIRNDRAYTDKEIQKVLELANERTRVIVLLLASSGIRLGCVSQLVTGDLEDKGDIYKITVYKNTKQEYFTYCTPECKKAIKTYFDIRERHGETINKKSPVIREQYDKRRPYSAIHAHHTTKDAITRVLQRTLELAGLRATPQEHEVMLAHGFRKFFNTQLVSAEINPLIKEMLMGHKVGLEENYYRPQEANIQNEYESAIDYLTIDPANRLQKKVSELQERNDRLDKVLDRVSLLEKELGIT